MKSFQENIPRGLVEDCAQEPIHIPGLIQPFGFLLACDWPGFLLITHASANAAQCLGLADSTQILGRALEDLVQSTSQSSVREFLNETDRAPSEVLEIRSSSKGAEGNWVLYAHVHQDRLICEFEPSVSATAGGGATARDLRSFNATVQAMQSAKDLSAMSRVLPQGIRELTGFDRVMVYRFDHEWNGEVVAEATNGKTDLYMGHHFPATDIPPQARAVFLSNWVRMIPDVAYQPLGLDTTVDPALGRPLDLSNSLLRSSSPIHIEYLVNMKVGATLTVSLKHEDRLWGIIACHHDEPRYITPPVRQLCEQVGRIFSALLDAKRQREDAEYAVQIARVHNILLDYMRQEDDFVSGLVRYQPSLLDLTAAQGAAAAVHFEGKWTLLGKVPRVDQIASLVRWLGDQPMPEGIFATDCLSAQFAPAREYRDVASGLLALKIPKSRENFILWFRPEVVQTVKWAGNPEKRDEKSVQGVRVHPRKSFSTWKQSYEYRSLPWKPSELDGAVALRRSIIEIDLERQFQKERVARAQVDREKRRFRLLAEAGAILAASLDYKRCLEGLAGLAVSRVCDSCVVYLKDGAGHYIRLLARHATEQGQVVLDRISVFPSEVEVPGSSLSAVINAGDLVLRPAVDESWIRSIASDDRHFAFLKGELGIRSVMAVPLSARGKVLGLILLVRSESRRRFEVDDLELAVELSARAAVAVDNALLFKEVQELGSAREDVVRVVAHDLKNPINALLLNIQLIQRDLKRGSTELPQTLAETLPSMARSGHAMRELVDAWLDVAKMEAGNMVLRPAPIAARELVTYSLESLRPVAAAKGVELVIEPEIGDWKFSVDASRMAQVFSNIVGNAIKFSPAQGTVTVGLSQREPRPIFFVRDQGCGIAPNHLSHIFDRYWQVRSTSHMGSGLGLAIAKGVVEAHGGEIKVESTLGVGTTFWISLPTPVPANFEAAH